MRFQFLEEDIRWNLDDNIRHEEDRQGGVVFSARLEVQVALKSKNGGITDIDTAQGVTPVSMAQYFNMGARSSYRSKKASRYKTHKHGSRCASILAINLRSLML